MKMKAIASGSNGNCIYINGGNTHILIDAGITCKRIVTELRNTGVQPEEISAVLVTHEHTDHTSGLKIFLKHYGCPLYGTRDTLEAIADADVKAEIPGQVYRPFLAGETFTIGDLEITSVHVLHDAADPVAYRIRCGEESLAVMTDTGNYTPEILSLMQGVNGLLLEANHDIRMLEMGSYPYPLKRRILSDHGHLSNERAGTLLKEILHPDLKFVLLGHLSEENNYPELALLSVKTEVDTADNGWSSSDFRIDVASRYESSALYET